MALHSTTKIQKLQNDLYLELDILTRKNYSYNLSMFVTLLCDTPLDNLLQILHVLRYVNKLDVKHPRRNRLYKKIVKLIASINNIDGADIHPIGQDLSINMYAKIAQDLLNVKRFGGIKNINTNEKTIDVIEQMVLDHNLIYERLNPEINHVIIHTQTDKKCWFRLKVKWENKVKDVKHLLTHPKLSQNLCGFYQLDDEVIELYYNKPNIKINDCIEALNTIPFVVNIIFFSNLRLFKEKCSCQLTKLSNIIKFYYCNVTKQYDFIISSEANIDLFNSIYLYSILLLYKDNLSVSTGNFSPNPIACLAGNGPSRTIKSKTTMMEPQSEYEKILTANNLDVDVRGTAMSKESIKESNRHVIYKIGQDRDMRIIYGQSSMGGCNLHEVVMNND